MSSDSIGNNTDISGALSSLNIGDNNESNNNGETTIIICANCGKEGGDNMNTCNKCKMVHYCNLACKKKHKSKHKKKCDRRVAELFDVELFKDPPREECPICMLPLANDPDQSHFKSCCGKVICYGCIYAILIEANQRGKKRENNLCPFCREPPESSNKESIKRLNKLMENGNAEAFNVLGLCFAFGTHGMPRHRAKAHALFLKAGELGCADAYCNLGIAYRQGEGVEIDMKKATHFFELAAMSGDVCARHRLGVIEGQAGNDQRAMKHFTIAARAGDSKCLENVKKGFIAGLVTKNEYESTLRAYHESQMEMKSEAREKIADIMAQRQPVN